MSRRLSQQPDRRKERGGERPELLAQLLPDPAGGKYSGVADEEVALDEKQRAGVMHDAGTADHDIADPHRDEEVDRSEEHTSEIQSLLRNSYAASCLKKKTLKTQP